MPSNSPAVNSLWLPAIALKTPVIIKPGRDEPWTPFRLIQAFIAAGVPRGGVRFLSDRSRRRRGDPEDLRTRADLRRQATTSSSTRTTRSYPVHGPGFSKILIGED